MSKKQLIFFYSLFYCFLILISYLPWAYYEDIQESFTGFYTHKNIYGKPALLLLYVGGFNGFLLFFSTLWARFLSLALMSIFFAYGIRNFYLYSSCHHGICPQLLFGLWAMIVCVFILFVFSLLGKVRVKKV